MNLKQFLLFIALWCFCTIILLGQTETKLQTQTSNRPQKAITPRSTATGTRSSIPKRPRRKSIVTQKKITSPTKSEVSPKIEPTEKIQHSERSVTSMQKVFTPLSVIEDQSFVFSMNKIDNEFTASIGAYYGGKQTIAFAVIDFLRQKGYFNTYKNIDPTSSTDYIRLTYLAKIVVPMKIRAEYFNSSQYYVKVWAAFDPTEVTSQIMKIFNNPIAEREYYMIDSLSNTTLRMIKEYGGKAMRSNNDKDSYAYVNLYRRLLSILNYYDAEYAMLNNSIQEAETGYKNAANYYPDFTLYHYKIAKIFYDRKEYYQAVSFFLEILKKQPNNNDVFYYVGTCYYFTRQFQQSIVYLEKLLDKVTQYDNLLFYIGESYRLAGDESKSINYYQNFILNNPNYTPAYVILGDVYRRIGNEPEALKYYLEYLKRTPNDISIMTYVALFFAKQKKVTEAFQYLDKINQIEPQNPMPFYYKGLIYGEVGENNRSIAMFIKAAQLGHKRSQALLSEAGISW